MKSQIRAAVQKVDSIFSNRRYSFLSHHDLKPFYLKYNEEKPFARHAIPDSDPEIFRALQLDGEKEQVEYLLHYPQECVIEPIFGWAIIEGRKVIQDSIPYSAGFELPKPLYLRSKLPGKKSIHLEAAISLRFNWDNYFHFYNDILGQLWEFDRAGVPKTTPILMPARAKNHRYFQDALQRSEELRSRQWISQAENEYVTVKEAYFGKNMPNVRRHFSQSLKALGVTPFTGSHSRRIFIKRKTTSPRSISNSAEIEEVALQCGLEVVDCDGMTLNDQIELFSSSSHVVGIHGAGLTNMIFRAGAPCCIFEIFPADCIRPHYFWLAREFGFAYSAMRGGSQINERFTLDPALFRESVVRYLGDN